MELELKKGRDIQDLLLWILNEEMEVLVCTTIGFLLALYAIPGPVLWSLMMFSMQLGFLIFLLLCIYSLASKWYNERWSTSPTCSSCWDRLHSSIFQTQKNLPQFLRTMMSECLSAKKTEETREMEKPAPPKKPHRAVRFANPEKEIFYYDVQSDDDENESSENGSLSSTTTSESNDEAAAGLHLRSILRSSSVKSEVEQDGGCRFRFRKTRMNLF